MAALAEVSLDSAFYPQEGVGPRERSLTWQQTELHESSRASKILGGVLPALGWDVFQAKEDEMVARLDVISAQVNTTESTYLTQSLTREADQIQMIRSVRHDVVASLAEELVNVAVMEKLASNRGTSLFELTSTDAVVTNLDKNEPMFGGELLDGLRSQSEEILSNFNFEIGSTAARLFDRIYNYVSRSKIQALTATLGTADEKDLWRSWTQKNSGQEFTEHVASLTTDSLIKTAANIFRHVNISAFQLPRKSRYELHRNSTLALAYSDEQIGGAIGEIIQAMNTIGGSALERQKIISSAMLTIQAELPHLIFNGKSKDQRPLGTGLISEVNAAADTYVTMRLTPSQNLARTGTRIGRGLKHFGKNAFMEPVDPGEPNGEKKFSKKKAITWGVITTLVTACAAKLSQTTSSPTQSVDGMDIPTINQLAISTPDASASSVVSQTTLTEQISQALQQEGFTAVSNNGLINSITSQESGSACLMSPPLSIQAGEQPAQFNGFGAGDGLAHYSSQGEVQATVLAAVPLEKDQICVLAQSNDQLNPLKIFLMAPNSDGNFQIIGDMNGQFGPKDEVKLRWDASGPKIVMIGGEGEEIKLEFVGRGASLHTATLQPTETLPATPTILPTATLTREPTITPTPDFPHLYVDGKLTFDWNADASKLKDLTEGGKPLTKSAIFNWLNSISTSGLVTFMPTSDNVCNINWRQNHSGGDKPTTQVLGFTSAEICTKENAPVRAIAPIRGNINYQENGSWYSLPLIIFAYQVYAPGDPRGYKLLPVIVPEQKSYLSSFSNPARYLSIDFGFTDPQLLGNYPALITARLLQELGLYNQNQIDATMLDWLSNGEPTTAIDGQVFVGHPSSLNNFQSP